MEKPCRYTNDPEGDASFLHADRSSGNESPQDHREAESSFAIPADDTASSQLMAKIDLHVLPTLTVIYVMSFLDRVNIGSALVYNLPQDLGLQGQQTNTALAIFFVSYVVFEIPATMFMRKIKPHWFLSLLMFAFGLLMTLQGFVQNYGGLVTVRFLMGIAEAGVYPGCFYLISMWYQRREAQKRFSFFFIGASVAGAFGGLLASAIGLLNGVSGYPAWRWIFILEGLLTCVLSVVSFFTISDFPEDAKWLSETERSIVLSRLVNDQGNSGKEQRFHPRDVLLIFRDWKVFLSAPLYFSLSVSAYGLAYFIPSIVATYGYSGIHAQLYSVVPWCVTLVFALLMAWASDRAEVRFPFIAFGLGLAFVGNIMLFTIHHNVQAEYAGIFLYLMGVISIVPIVVCWLSMNLKGHKERAVGIPWQVGFGNAAGIVGTFAFPSADAPTYKLGYGLGLGFLCLAAAITLSYLAGYRTANRHLPVRDKFVL